MKKQQEEQDVAVNNVQKPVIEMGVKSEERQPRFYIEKENLDKLNSYLAIAGQSEAQGFLEYKSAFHKFVQMVQESLKVE